MISNENLENILKNLKSEEERQAALEILQQLATTGNSELLNELKYSDFDEIPVNIHTFLHDRKYLGNGLYDKDGRFTLFPYWEKTLEKVFPDNLTTAYNTLILTGCLAYDTEIPLLNGTVVKIGELAKQVNIDEYVYAYDIETDSYVPGHLIAAFSTGYKPVYKITLDNGTIIKATSNHKFMTQDKHWKSIDTGLTVNDSLLSYCNKQESAVNSKTYKIITVEYLTEEEVFDLTIDKYHNFILNNGVIAHNSIGIGKSTCAVICLLYMLYRLLCMKDPYLYYGMQPIDKISISLMNNTLENAKGVALDKLNQLILASDWFMSHGYMSGTTNLRYIPNKHIEFVVASSNNQIIGRALFCLDGKTIIKTTEGYFKLNELVDKDIKVISIDKNGNEVISDSCTVKPTLQTNEEYQIKLEDGTIIKCTPEHRFMLVDGSYKMAKDLTETDELAEVPNDEH